MVLRTLSELWDAKALRDIRVEMVMWRQKLDMGCREREPTRWAGSSLQAQMRSSKKQGWARMGLGKKEQVSWEEGDNSAKGDQSHPITRVLGRGPQL